MKEAFMHTIWKYKLHLPQMHCTEGKKLEITQHGRYNELDGPDFLMGKIEYDGVEWVGSIEMHVNEMDWVGHGHEADPKYRNVILHVVWNTSNLGSAILKNTPVLDLSQFVEEHVLFNYHQLTETNKALTCTPFLENVFDIDIQFWLEKQFIERLEIKAEKLNQIKKSLNIGNFESFLHFLVARMGGKNNKAAFDYFSEIIDAKVLLKYAQDHFKLEAILFGQANIVKAVDAYSEKLAKEFEFLQKKHQLRQMAPDMFNFKGTRPPGFPTQKIAMIAALIHGLPYYSDWLGEETDSMLKKVKKSDYWSAHYSFSKPNQHALKLDLSKNELTFLWLNVILPLRFNEHKRMDNLLENMDDLIEKARKFPMENNAIIRKFSAMNSPAFTAMEGQALIQLYTNYCEPLHCLNCQIGIKCLSLSRGL